MEGKRCSTCKFSVQSKPLVPRGTCHKSDPGVVAGNGFGMWPKVSDDPNYFCWEWVKGEPWELEGGEGESG
jgi:hypothetical protein